MGCGCGKAFTQVKFEAIHQRENAQDKLQQFLLSNVESLQQFFQDLGQEKAKAGLYLPGNQENPGDLALAVSNWALTGHLHEVLERFTRYIREYQVSNEDFKEISLLLELLLLLGTDLSSTFHLLRVLFYLYKKQLDERKEGDRSLWASEDLQSKAIHDIFRRGRRLQPELSIPRAFTEDDQLHLGCYFCALTLFPDLLQSETQMEDAFQGVLLYCLSPSSQVQVAIAGLDFCLSCIHSKRISDRILTRFPASSFAVHDKETFDQLIEVMDSYQTMSEEAWSQVFKELETRTLNVKFDALIRYLEQPNKLEKFIDYFQRPQVAHRLFKLCLFLVQSSASSGFEACQRLMDRMLSNISLVTLPNEAFEKCQDSIRELYQHQFSYNVVSERFSEDYFNRLSNGNDDLYSESEIREQLGTMLLYALTRNPSFLFKRINAVLHNCLTQLQAYSKLMYVSIEKCVNALPELRESVLENAERVLSTLKSRESGQTANAITPEDNEDIYLFVDRLIRKVKKTSCKPIPPIPVPVLDMINTYLEYGEQLFTPPDGDMKQSELIEKHKKSLTEIKEKFTKSLGKFDYSKVDLSFYSTSDHFFSFVCGAIVRNLEKLERKDVFSEEFSAKWRGHLQMLRRASKSSLMALAFDTSQVLELQLFSLTYFLSVFDRKRRFYKPEKVFNKSRRLEQEIVRVYLSGFQRPDKGSLGLIHTVARSACLREAFTNLKLNPDCLSICPDKAFFADLEQSTLGISIFGGCVILSNKLREATDMSKCGLMITMAHELAHMGKRIKGNSVIRAHSGLFNYQLGRPGDKKNVTISSKEGGFRLEQILFGARVMKLSNSQMQFLISKENWDFSLEEFKSELHSLGVASGESEVHNIPRTEFGLHYLERGKACRFKGS